MSPKLTKAKALLDKIKGIVIQRKRLVIAISVGAIALGLTVGMALAARGIYRYFFPPKPRLSSEQIESLLSEDEPEPGTSTGQGSEDWADDLEEWQAGAILYENCGYNYSLHYPAGWEGSQPTPTADRAVFYSEEDEINLAVEAYLKTYSDLDQFAEEMLTGVEGEQTAFDEGDIRDTRVLAAEYEDPPSAHVFWERDGFQMVLLIDGAGVATQVDLVRTLLASFNNNPTSLSCDPDTPAPISNDGGGAPCNHPNGDLHYWWNDVNQATRDCFIETYGVTPALKEMGY